ncbi:MAG: prolyl oligopeptidase family serine peptidase [Verrucomicrobiota bacterium]
MSAACFAAETSTPWTPIAPFFTPPAEFAGQLGAYRSPLKFNDGALAKSPADWAKRRQEILAQWHRLMGPWPPLLAKPKLEIVETARRDNFTQHKVRVEIAAGVLHHGYLLIPDGNGPFPAVFVPFYDPETSIGLKGEFRDFAYQLTRRGFFSLSIGSPGGDARKPDVSGAVCQPLSFLAYVAANCHTALAQRKEVDPARIGVVGHSYGGKWAMFASCLYDKFACAVWSDPGIVFDEKRPSINYWEPWYLGLDPGQTRKPGVITPERPRTGAYKVMMEKGRDLHELHALMAPRPFLVSGGSEDFPARWVPLNHAIAVNQLLGQTNRVAMTNRKDHSPNAESNEQIYSFFEHFLKPPSPAK